MPQPTNYHIPFPNDFVRGNKIRRQEFILPDNTVPTVPIRAHHHIPGWISDTDIYLGEIAIDLESEKVYTRVNSGIIEIGSSSDKRYTIRPNETITVLAETERHYAHNLYNKGIVTIDYAIDSDYTAGDVVPRIGVLRVDSTIFNEGTIINNGLIIN